MSDSEYDDSPFAERKTNRMVWIVPSVLVHVIILVVWLSMPKAPPREPTQRKLTINSQQAQQLQQHVEDANLVLLHSKVEELQEIKKAMSQIRESRMDKLRNFETEMAEAAPVDAKDLFTQFISAQTKILGAYEQILEDIKQSEAKAPALKEFLANEDLIAAAPLLAEVDTFWQDAHNQMKLIGDETMLAFALVNSGDVQLEWILDPAIEQERNALKQAMLTAQNAAQAVDTELGKHFGGNAGKAMTDLKENAEAHAGTLQEFADAKIAGEAAAEQKRQDVQARMDKAEAEIELLRYKIKPLAEERQILWKKPGNGKAAEKLNVQVKRMEKEISKLQSQIRKDENNLKKVSYTPDRNLEKKVKGIKSAVERLYSGTAPEIETVTEALKTQAEVTRSANALLESIARQAASVNAGGGK